jgi:WxcM-like, C-terminal
MFPGKRRASGNIAATILALLEVPAQMTSSRRRVQTKPGLLFGRGLGSASLVHVPAEASAPTPPPAPGVDLQTRPHPIGPPRVIGTGDCMLIDLPKIHDPRGNLTFIEAGRHVPFEIERAFWIYDVPGGSVRGGHAYRTVHECILALSGSFELMVDDGSHHVHYTLNRSYHALLIPNLIWREMINFSTNSVALVLASGPFEPADYVHDYGDFLRLRSMR